MEVVVRFRSLTALGLIALGLMFAAPASGAAEHTIDIVGFSYAPNTQTANLGDTIVFRNIAPNATHSSIRTQGAFTFDTGEINPGESSMAIALTQVGTFPYICGIHGASMSGTIVVQDVPAVVPESPWVAGMAISATATALLTVAWRSRRRRRSHANAV
jgi:plastocyanin